MHVPYGLTNIWTRVVGQCGPWINYYLQFYMSVRRGVLWNTLYAA